ncbi:G- coupled receptor 55-like protein [Labeo rohita]|uniref:G-coupled receptor 55-like protein n=2 Tax=Labeo rohita TaxID=84645 RepID=A0A498P057_LABRO|nr:G-protein coupled receptor 55 [Labeo rohita]XP_050951574.1 G-protein coupled receptor 55 [Labeo rohita]KAI2650729.1 G-protein coupled receptor 55 [Labeo rohita]RXN20808.1 G- coupled receptor 55-like protein [Labeo rohita]RXN37289.1 G- coupled receptor 55-like protein [Labeo rohita]
MPNCTLNITTGIQTFQLATMIPTFILGVLVNIYVLVTFCRLPRSAWTNMNIYISNMAIADCVVLVLLPVRFASHIWESSEIWDQTNRELCFVLVSVYYVNMYVSIFTVTAISVVRYVAIKYPLKAREILSRGKALVVCALIWLVTCSFSAMFHYVDKPEHNSTIKCFQKNKEGGFPLSFILVLNIVGFLVPFLIMLFCSVNVIFKLRKQLKIGSRTEKLQCMFIISANLIVFVVCFFPVHFGFFFKYITQAYNHSCEAQYFAHNFVHGAMCVSNMNCALDSFSYYFATRTSWKLCTPKQTAREEYKCNYKSVAR